MADLHLSMEQGAGFTFALLADLMVQRPSAPGLFTYCISALDCIPPFDPDMLLMQRTINCLLLLDFKALVGF
jgi:hypothetical protein